MQIRVGKQIGSDAMIADGQHTRVDGLTSLAVLIAVIGTWLGVPILDPIIGIVIAIVGITWNANKTVWYRLMDAVDPAVIHRMKHYASEVAGVEQVASLRAHWVGHRLYGEIIIVVEETLSLVEGDTIAENVKNFVAS